MSTATAPTNDLATIVRKEGLTVERAQSILDVFTPLVEEAAAAINAADACTFGDDPSDEDTARAAEHRKVLTKLRTRTETARKTLKEDSLRMGQAVDAAGRWIRSRIEPAEERVLAVEQTAIRREQERRRLILEGRRKSLMATGTNPDQYRLDEMTETDFASLLSDRKAIQESRERQEREQAEARKAEEARLAEERRKLEEENARLRKEREAAEAKARKERAEAEAKLRAERQAREKAEADAEAARREQEKKAQAEARAKRKAANAPDREKFLAIAAAVRAIAVPEMKTEDGKRVRGQVVALLESAATKIDGIVSSME